MSVVGYLSGRGASSRMRATAAEEVGARFEGEVLSGEVSVRERFAREAAGVVVPGADYYRDVEEYDAVLQAHCRVGGLV